MDESAPEFPDVNPSFPPPPRPRSPGLLLEVALFATGTIVIAVASCLYVVDGLSRIEFAAGYFIGLLLTAYGVKLLRERQSVRGLWVNGQIVPGMLISSARLPYIGAALFSCLASALGTVWLLMDLGVIYLVIGMALLVVLERVSRRLNSAQVFLVVDGEELVARLPMNELWKKRGGEDCIWVAVVGRKSAALHVAGPVAPEYATPDGASCGWIAERLDQFLQRTDDE